MIKISKEKMRISIKRLGIILILLMVAVMATSVLMEASAEVTPSTILPDFLIRAAEYMSHGNSTQKDIYVHQMITQNQIKQEKIASTKGAVLQPPLNPQSTSWMMGIWYVAPPTIDTVTGATVGYMSNAGGLVGQNDGNYAYLFTNGWNEVYTRDGAHGGEAFAWGPMYNYYGAGNVYVSGAYTDQPYWDNDVIIWTSNDHQHWNYLNYAKVTSWNSPSTFYVGYSSSSFQYIAVNCWTPPPYPTYYSPLIMNSVYIDSVRTYT